VALEAAPAIPSEAAIKRAAKFTREPFVLEGEDVASQLAPGSARRRAFDAALAELDHRIAAITTRDPEPTGRRA
jgi:hypothetical protein